MRRVIVPALFTIALMLPPILVVARLAKAQALTGSIKGTVSATAGDTSARPELLPGAHLTLTNRDLPDKTFTTETDATGSFSFPELPAATYMLTAEATGLPAATREIKLTTGANLVVEIVLTASVNESVTVKDEEGLLSAGEIVTSNTVRAEKMEELPLRADNYQGALPLTPTVVRDVAGQDHIKGTQAGQNSYTLNGADLTDPVSGNLAFDIPLEAAANVHVEDNPYSAEFGRTSGGASNLETQTGGNKIKFGAARVFPVFHRIIGGKLDSFRPRVTFSGPLIGKRLSFVQSFEYRFSRTYVPSQLAPRDNSTAAAFNSFTQLDLTLNQRNTLKFMGALFPEKKRFVGLNTFNPQETTANTKQRGELVSISEQAIFADDSFLSSLFSFKTFAFDVFPQRTDTPLTLTPDGNSGSYFGDTRRSSRRWQWQEQYFARALNFHGQHSLKLGGELEYTTMVGRFDFQPIVIRRADKTVAERIDFAAPTEIRRPLLELGGFIQDRWTLSPNFVVDAGLRVDRNSFSAHNDISPRLAILYHPFHSQRTTVRAGVGIFYDRSLLQTRYFELTDLDENDDLPDGVGVNFHTNFPARIVTTYELNGRTVVDGPRTYVNVIRSPWLDARSTRWSAQVDRNLTKRLTVRLGYLRRATSNEAIILPKLSRTGGGLLVLKSRGTSNYHELQALAIYDSPRFHNWNISYVWSRAQGSLNTADNFLGDFPAYVVRANQFGRLPFDVPHRLLAYGELKAPHAITLMPAFEIRSGFPYSIVNERLDFVGGRNHARFPTYMSLDATVLKGFKLPFFDKHARAGVIIFNITNHFNPRDVQNNIGSPHFGQFYNSLSTSVRGKFELDF